MIKKTFKFLMTFLSVCILLVGTSLYALPPEDHVEGGYVGNDPTSDNVVMAFLQHFVWEEFAFGHPNQFTIWNNAQVDSMDFAYYCGHGSHWTIWTYWGPIYLETAGGSDNLGYGDTNLEFIAYHSCSVIPSPEEVTNWWGPWISEPDDTFDGLHQSLGFRTPAYIASAPDIADYYGGRIYNNWSVLWSWFEAIDVEGIYGECGSVVLYPGTEADTYGFNVPDPPQNHQSLRIWYQVVEYVYNATVYEVEVAQ